MYKMRLYHLRAVQVDDYETSTAQSYFTPHMFSQELYDVLQPGAKERFFEFPVINVHDVNVFLNMNLPIHAEWTDDVIGVTLMGRCELYHEYGADNCPLKATNTACCWRTECPRKTEELYTYRADNVEYLVNTLLSRCVSNEDADRLREFAEYAKTITMGDGFFYALFTDWNWE